MGGRVAEMGAEVGAREHTPSPGGEAARRAGRARRLGFGVSQVGTGDEPRREGPGWGRGRSLWWDREGVRARPRPRGNPAGLRDGETDPGDGRGSGPGRGRRGPGDGVQGRGSAGGTPGRGGQSGPQAAPGRRSPRPCPSGRSGPWRRREARLARSLARRSASRRPRPRPLRPPQEVPGGLPRSSSAAPAAAT